MQPQQQMVIPIEINLNEAQVQVQDAPPIMPGGKILRFITRAGICVNIILDERSSKGVAAALSSGIMVASGPLPSGNGGLPTK